MRISDWSSDVCSSDLRVALLRRLLLTSTRVLPLLAPYANRSLRAGLHRRIASDLEAAFLLLARERLAGRRTRPLKTITTAERELRHRSEEHTSDLQSLMRTPYTVFCLKKKNNDI